MNPFEPSSLSPLPKTPIECGLPYDLAWGDLQKVLLGFVEGQCARAQAFSSHEKQGLNGGSNSCILTLRYPIGDNQFRSETVFIKQAADPSNKEAQKYRALESFGVPTPRLLTSIQKDNAEIILLEFLPKIGIDFHSAKEVNDLLHLVAQVNSIQEPADLFNPSPGIPQEEFDKRLKSALRETARDQTLPFTIDIPCWFDAYQTARTACKSMPRAVNHNEFSFQQVGWAQREGNSQLVIFDLETMGWSPRFSDIAGVLNSLARHTGRDPIELFEIYFDRLCELNPPELGMEEAFQEQRLVRVKDAFDSLPWHVEIAKSHDLDQKLDNPFSRGVNCLYADLVACGFV
jgi:hypothetical protein